jgi:hypothetical protein
MLAELRRFMIGCIVTWVSVMGGLGIFYLTHSKALSLISMAMYGLALVSCLQAVRNAPGGSHER